MWFLLSLLAGFLFAANRLIVRAVLAKKVNALAFGAIHEIIAGVLLIPVAFFSFGLPQSPEIWLALSLGVLGIFGADVLTFFSLRNTEASVYQIVGQLRHVVVLAGAFFLFTEVITLSKIISIIFIMLGVAVALLDKSKIEITRGVIYAVLSTISIAFAFLFIKQAAVDVPPAFSACISLIISGVLTYLLFFMRREGPFIIPRANQKQLLIAAVTFAIFELTLFSALAIGEASKVTPVTQSSMIFTLIGGYIFLNEKGRLKEKILGSILIAFGIIILYFF